MKIVYCVDQLEVVGGGMEHVVIMKANTLSKMPENDVYIVMAYCCHKHSFPISEKVHMVNLDVQYYGDVGLNKVSAVLYLRRKRKEHRKKLLTVLNQIMPDVVISVGNSERLFLSQLKVISKPVFIREVHSHKYYRRMWAKGWFEKLAGILSEFIEYNFYINRYDRIVILTEKDKWDNWNADERVAVIPNPLENLSPDSSTMGNTLAISAGRLVDSKNFSSMIRAWNVVAQLFPDWKLDIYGEGNLRNQLQEEIDAFHLTNSIKLCGFTSDLTKKMCEASFFVFTSVCESFGMVLTEAMGCGLPVISYDCPYGPAEIIEEGKNGFLVPMNDEKVLADRIIQLISNHKLCEEMGKAAKKRAEDFSMDKICNQWMALFRELREEKNINKL